MNKTTVMLIHSLIWALAILCLGWWIKESASQTSWLFCAVALWCCSHILLQYGFCRRRQAAAEGSDCRSQCHVTTKKS